MTIVMYTTKCYTTDIKEVTVDRVTESSVFINGKRSARVSDWQIFHTTKDDAVSFLIGRAQAKVDNYTRSLTCAEKELSEVKRKYNIGA